MKTLFPRTYYQSVQCSAAAKRELTIDADYVVDSDVSSGIEWDLKNCIRMASEIAIVAEMVLQHGLSPHTRETLKMELDELNGFLAGVGKPKEDLLQDKITTDSLGFPLFVSIRISSDLSVLGSCKSYSDPSGAIPTNHFTLEFKKGMPAWDLVCVASHEVFHLFSEFKIHITADEETQAEVFGSLVRKIVQLYDANRVFSPATEEFLPKPPPPATAASAPTPEQRLRRNTFHQTKYHEH